MNASKKLPECFDRLRGHAESGRVAGPLYQDLQAVFDALGLPPLPASPPRQLLDSDAVPPNNTSPLNRSSSSAGIDSFKDLMSMKVRPHSAGAIRGKRPSSAVSTPSIYSEESV